ncbi:MAG: PAS domain-containing protein [Deltaproteobacteria bacterium]|nr:PAS domain-containing protein [Deltaproteobacteria bacterium]
MAGPMDVRATTLEEFLGAVLRGAAKILGCGSTNLVFINDKSQQIGIRLGTMAGAHPIVRSVEKVLGNRMGEFVFPVKQALDSLVYRSWKEKKPLETSSFAELVGTAFPSIVTSQMSRLIGDHRFICVPLLSGSRSYGVLVIEKDGLHPFNRQQREVIVRYARRIGEILENDMMGQSQQLFADLRVGGPDYYLLGEGGQLLGLGAHSASSPEMIAELVQRVGSSGTVQARASGDKRTEIVPFRVGEAPAVLVRQQRPPEAAVSLENQLLQLTLGDAVPSLCVDPQLRITSANQAIEAVLGYRPSALVGRPIGELFASPREIEAILSQQVLDLSNPYSEESATIVQQDGTIAPARVEALLLVGDNDEAVGFLLLIRKAADHGEAGEDDGDRLVKQERMASMGELAAQLAHEVRNPLVAIGANLESLARDPSVAREHRDILASLGREIVRLDMTLKDYLAARHDMSFAEVDLARAVEDARRLLEGAYRVAGKKVTSSVEPGVSVLADHDALKHVLFNLLHNALEASPPEGEVHCSATAEPGAVTIHIDDHGPGLTAPADDCFRPFFTTKKNGTGLGLAVCQKIARAHGGLVSIRNREEGGCRATVVLPRRLRHGAHS